jgi:hypothetical protein
MCPTHKLSNVITFFNTMFNVYCDFSHLLTKVIVQGITAIASKRGDTCSIFAGDDFKNRRGKISEGCLFDSFSRTCFATF